MYARLKVRILLFCLGLSKVRSTFDQLANLHTDTLRDRAPFLCMERSNRIPMEIFRLATRNENQRTNGPVNALFYHFGWTPSRKNVWIRKLRSSKGHHFIKL